MRTTTLVCLSVLLVVAACAPGGRGEPGGARVQPPAAARRANDPAPRLAQFVGRWDGERLTLERVAAPALPAAGTSVQAVTLGAVTASTSGSGSTPMPPDGTVDLHQTTARGVDTGCNATSGTYAEPAFPTSSVPSPFQGVCFSIDMVSGFLSQELVRAHVEVTALHNDNASGAIVTYNDSPSDSDFGTDGTRGLWNYGRLAAKGTMGVRAAGGATVDLSRSNRNWFFATPEAGAAARFTFTLDVRGLALDPVRRAAPAMGGAECTPTGHPALSQDGQYVVFATGSSACRGGAGGALQVVRRELATGATVLVSHAGGSGSAGNNGANTAPSVSNDGRFVAWEETATDALPGGVDANGASDGNGALATIAVRDLATDAIYLGDVDFATGASGVTAAHRPSVTHDGSAVVFDSADALDVFGGDGNNLRDVYLGFFVDGFAQLVSPDTGSRTADATGGAPDTGGDQVAWLSADPSFASGDTNGQPDVFQTDMATGGVTWISARAGGGPSNGAASCAAIAANGSAAAFLSTATNLDPVNASNPSSAAAHVYVLAPGVGAGPMLADVTTAGAPANGAAACPSFGVNRMVTFVSNGSNLDPLDASAGADAYLFDALSPDPRRHHAALLSATAANAPANAVASAAVVGDADEQYTALTTSAALAGGSPPAGLSVYAAPLR